MLSLIANGTGRGLHRRLAAIDPEVQGTGIEPVKLDSGEEVLQVSYGLREVGALRIVDTMYWRDALKQSFEVGDKLSLKDLLADTTGPVLGASQTLPLLRLKRFLNNCDHNHGQQCSIEGPPLVANANVANRRYRRVSGSDDFRGQILRAQLRLEPGRHVGNAALEFLGTA